MMSATPCDCTRMLAPSFMAWMPGVVWFLDYEKFDEDVLSDSSFVDWEAVIEDGE